MPVDISPLMDHPGWKTITPAQRKQALDLWQDPDTSESDRAQMRQIMDGWASAAAEEPSGPAKVVSSVGGMLKAIPPLAHAAVVAPMNRAGGYDPNAPPAEKPQTPHDWEFRTLPMQQELAEGANTIPGLMAGPAWGKAGYKAGETILSKLTPALANRPMVQTVANTLPAVGEAGGNYLSRQANVAMGAEQPGVVGDIASAAIPLGVRAATSAPVARRLPGSAATQHEMAAEDLGAMTTRMQPSTPAATLYGAVVQQGNPTIDVQGLRQTARELITKNTQRGAATRDPEVLKLAQELEDLAQQYNNQVPMDVLYDRMQGTGEILGSVQSTGSRGSKDISKLYAGFHGALENASQSNIPGAETLQQAIKASRQEHAVERLQRITGAGRGITTQQGTGYTLVSGKKMLNEFERLVADDDVFRGSFTADELAEMRAVFEGANKVPALPPPPSVQRGAGKAALSGSIGGGIGYAIAGPEGAKIGTMAGVAAPEVISRLMVTSGGRAMLRAAFEGRDIIRPEVLAVLNQAARQGPETFTSKRSGSTSP